jgi:hypothetical protein
MKALIRGITAAVFVGIATVPIRGAPAQTEIAPSPGGDGSIQGWESQHGGTPSCHDICGGENCCAPKPGTTSTSTRSPFRPTR